MRHAKRKWSIHHFAYQAKPFDLTAVPKDVLISCTAPNQAAAQGRLPSRFRKLTSVGGNALAGTGTLGLLADVASDSAFAYPVYDKADNDKPNMGKASNAGKYSEFLIKQAT